MIFDRPSTRTRVSFDVGMRELGGESIMLTGAEMQLGRGETIADTARVLSRYVDAIVIRILSQDDMQEMAAHATVPVINGLTKQSHPCQVLADVMTFEEKRGPIRGRKIAWSRRLQQRAVVLDRRVGPVRLSRSKSPARAELQPSASSGSTAARKAGANIAIGDDPVAAVKDAAAVISDCWVSMGDEDEGRRHNLLAPYQVNAELMSRAAPDAIFMHCLPAHRGEEVTDEVIDGPQSVVFDEAENRLHAQKGVLAWCLGVDAMSAARSARPRPRSSTTSCCRSRSRRSSTRGRLVRLGPAIDLLLKRHDYPEPVSKLVAEAVTLAALLGSTLKTRAAASSCRPRATGRSPCCWSISTRRRICARSRGSTRRGLRSARRGRAICSAMAIWPSPSIPAAT